MDETQDEGGTDVGTKQTTGKQGEAGKGGAQGGSDADDADDDELDDLLNDDEDDEDEADGEEDDEDDEDGEDGGDKGKQKPKSKPLSQTAVNKLLADQQAKFQSEMDRRINQVVRKLKSGTDDKAGDGKGGGKAGQGKQQEADGDEQLRRLDAREARMAMRDSLGGATSGWTEAEKQLAADLGKAQLPGLLETDDPDEAGSKAAAAAVEKVAALRTEIEKALVAKLKRKGLLKTDGQPGGGSPSGQRQPRNANTSDQMTKAKDRAARMNAAAGIKAPA